jgi:predicted dehydrogenase
MKESLRVAVVGCGYWGPNLVRNFRGFPDCALLDVCDAQPARLRHMRSLYPDLATHESFDALLQVEGLDAVVIATPVHLHHRLALQALEAGKHVMIEKPMASSTKQCEDLAAAAARRHLTLMVGHTFLFSPHVVKIKELVASGDIGEIQYISSRRLNLGLYQKDINVVWDLAPHDISIVEHLLEEQASAVNCQGVSNVTPGIEDICTTTLSFPSGRFATLQTSWLDPRKVREMTIVGTRKMIVYDDLEPMHKIRIYNHRVEKPAHFDTFGEFQYAYIYGDISVPYVKPDEPLKRECRHFLDCIRGTVTPIASAAAGTNVVRVLEAASASLRQRGAYVELAPQK